MTGPQPIAKPQVAANSEVTAEPLLNAGNSQTADSIFHLAMLSCGLCVLALVGLIVYELMSGSRLSWHAFGLKFFFRSEWDPVNEQFGASAICLWHACVVFPRPPDCSASRDWCGCVYHRNVSALAERTAGLYHGTSRSDSQRHLWTVGDLRVGASSAPVWRAFFARGILAGHQGSRTVSAFKVPSKVRHMALACWRPESFWPLWSCPSSLQLREK